MIFVQRAGLAAGLLAKDHGNNTATSERRGHLKANARRSSGRSDRSAAEEPRSGGRMLRIRLGLTADASDVAADRHEACGGAAAGLPGSGRGVSRAIHSETVLHNEEMTFRGRVPGGGVAPAVAEPLAKRAPMAP